MSCRRRLIRGSRSSVSSRCWITLRSIRIRRQPPRSSLSATRWVLRVRAAGICWLRLTAVNAAVPRVRSWPRSRNSRRRSARGRTTTTSFARPRFSSRGNSTSETIDHRFHRRVPPRWSCGPCRSAGSGLLRAARSPHGPTEPRPAPAGCLLIARSVTRWCCMRCAMPHRRLMNTTRWRVSLG